MIRKKITYYIFLFGVFIILFFPGITFSQDIILQKIPSWRAFPDCSESIEIQQTACRLTEHPTAREAIVHLGTGKYSIWNKGNIWTVAYRADEDSVNNVQLIGGIQLPLSKFENTNIWAISINIPGLDSALITTAISYQKGTSFVSDNETHIMWRGKFAGPKLKKNENLGNKFVVDSLWSDTLKVWRKISIYRPARVPINGKYPVVYFADGQGVDIYAQIIDPLIESELLPPIILVGIWGRRGLVNSNEPYSPINDYRTVEYHEGVEEYPGADSLLVLRHHLAHKYFFTHEVPKKMETEYNVSPDGKFKAIHGVSSGANFSLLIGRELSDRYGFIIANSLGPKTVNIEPVNGWENAAMHYISIGLLEQRSMRSNLIVLHDSLKFYGIPSVLNIYPSGHDSGAWIASFPKALEWWMREITDN